uniref:RNA helicase n=1 Tax=Cyclopterus lumpus TaxID=8103 RepID=A0A8C2ZTD4_CYCLU
MYLLFLQSLPREGHSSGSRILLSFSRLHMSDLQLRAYQEEVVERALLGENIIIWLPTGGGKTRAAVYVAKRHLETTPQAKVVVLVNKVHLVDQHHTKEFHPHLGRDYTLVAVSGESKEKDFFGPVVKKSQVVICTAQILYNALTTTEETKHVELSDITLLIIDECHGTNKDSVYNKVMACYMEKKLKKDLPLPQILGLTASPGSGGAKNLQKAVNHVLEICANLDSAIVSTKTHVSELKQMVPRPIKTFDIVEKRLKDPFGGHLKSMMQMIHEYMTVPPDFRLRQFGTQEYEADVVIIERQGVSQDNRLLAQCALHLRQYNNALLINSTLRMMDAYRSLEEFYINRSNTAVDGTDIFLVGLFQENQVELQKLAKDSLYENPKMGKLESTLLNQFGPSRASKGILFSKTRKSIHCLYDWILTNEALQEAGIKAAILTGAGNGITYMTQNEQADTIRKFRQGTINLLISTSVAEEGLDIPECNLVVRYGLLTNEIAQQQASGRARATDSQYSVVAEEGGQEVKRELTNEYLEDLTGKAIAQVQDMSPREFRTKITELQTEALICRKRAETCKIQKRSCNTAASIQLLCRTCFTPVASGSDIKLLAKGHYVNYKKCVVLPNLAIKELALNTPHGRITVKKWKDVPFTVEDFSFEEYQKDNFDDFLD